jgi:septum formation protein
LSDRSRAQTTPPAARLVLASTSPQRHAILGQLGIAHDVVAPAFDEHPGGDPLDHAAGKARSVDGGGRPVLGVDTVVDSRGARFGKPADLDEAAAMLSALAGATHEVVSGLCLRTPAFEELHRVTTCVRFRPLSPVEIDGYLESGEWRGARVVMRSRVSALPSSNRSRATT